MGKKEIIILINRYSRQNVFIGENLNKSETNLNREFFRWVHRLCRISILVQRIIHPNFNDVHVYVYVCGSVVVRVIE